LEAGKVRCGGLKLHAVDELIMDLLVRYGGQRRSRESVCDVKVGPLSVINTEAVPLKGEDHALETTWGRGKRALEDCC